MEGEGRRGAEGEPGGGADGDRGGYEVVLRQAALVEDLQGRRAREAEAGRRRRWRDEQLEQEGGAEISWGLLGDAYDRCGEVCAEYAKTFYLGEVQDCLSVTEDEYSHLGC